MANISRKTRWNHRKHWRELVAKSKMQYNKIFLDENVAIKVIMDCRTTSANKFRKRLGFKQNDAILTKEKPLLTKIMSSFEGEHIQTQYHVLSYRIDLNFHDYNLAIEIVENENSYRNIDYEIKRQKAIYQQLGCKFFRIDCDKEDFGIFRSINEIFRHIKQSTKNNNE